MATVANNVASFFLFSFFFINQKNFRIIIIVWTSNLEAQCEFGDNYLSGREGGRPQETICHLLSHNEAVLWATGSASPEESS